jgi:hypothetical protein
MSQFNEITFQAQDLNLSYAHHVAREHQAISLRLPKVDGLSPSPDYINACAPLRSQMEVIADARRDAPKFKEQAEQNAALQDKREALERVSRFLGETKTQTHERGR